MRRFFEPRALRFGCAASLILLAASPALALPSDGLGPAPAPRPSEPIVLAAKQPAKSGGHAFTPGPPPNQHVTVPPAPPPAPPAPPPAPPPQPVSPTFSNPGSFGGAAAAPAAAPASASPSSAAAAASARGRGGGAGNGFPSVNLPPPGETRFKPDQVVVFMPRSLPASRIARILRRHRLEEIDSSNLSLSGLTLRVWSFKDHRTVARVERELAREAGLNALQPNYIFHVTDEVAAVSGAGAAQGMYALDTLRVAAGLDIAGGEPIKVAVVDTAIDEAHPELVGAVEARFDAFDGATPPRSRDHGTAMAGAIAARGQVRGVAPSVRILSARAFDTDGAGGALGSSMTIVKGIDWAVHSGARVVNMSFAGPKDPALHDTLAAAAKRGVVLIGAMGNSGPKSPPLYPGADENVIAITATDAQDHIFELANVGPYVAVAAPGVDVLLPAPNGAYSLETGTSVSAALASGVAALALERKQRATPLDVRKWLTQGARRPLAGADKALIGAGVIDATATMRAVGGEALTGR